MALTAEDVSRLYAHHAAELLGYVVRRTLEPEVALDIVAETFARAFEHRERFRDGTQPDELRAWLFTVARRLLVDDARRNGVELAACRRLGIQRRPLDDAEYERIERLTAAAPLRRRVAERLEALPDDQREAVRRRVVDEEPYRVIAATLGVSEQVVRARVSRGLRTLRNHLSPTEAADHA
ncbi:RNA polymerase sigma factor [Patulibacter sp. S7RM1-6]